MAWREREKKKLWYGVKEKFICFMIKLFAFEENSGVPRAHSYLSPYTSTGRRWWCYKDSFTHTEKEKKRGES